jgi:hypothetical protein
MPTVFRCLIGCLLPWAAMSLVGADRVGAQTPPPATAAARLKLIAEEPQPQATPSRADPFDGEPPPRPIAAPPPNDPTAPGPEMRRLLGDETPNAPASAPAYPDIRLRARMIVHGKPPIALIEVMDSNSRSSGPTPLGGPPGVPGPTGSHPQVLLRVIREGDEFVLPQGDVTSPIRVVKLTADEVILEMVNRKLQIRLD